MQTEFRRDRRVVQTDGMQQMKWQMGGAGLVNCSNCDQKSEERERERAARKTSDDRVA